MQIYDCISSGCYVTVIRCKTFSCDLPFCDLMADEIVKKLPADNLTFPAVCIERNERNYRNKGCLGKLALQLEFRLILIFSLKIKFSRQRSPCISVKFSKSQNGFGLVKTFKLLFTSNSIVVLMARTCCCSRRCSKH